MAGASGPLAAGRSAAGFIAAAGDRTACRRAGLVIRGIRKKKPRRKGITAGRDHHEEQRVEVLYSKYNTRLMSHFKGKLEGGAIFPGTGGGRSGARRLVRSG
jgi:hypothetical protein